ncbi:hypothetical protein [Microbacterium dauci]|uniref:Uncharacterized protein n=1 Tax=Microbacterium dauci TaxID=3048008 RepID=A0ABT6ZAP4_9MICO|nr:hypothetical protein [Microbacterium sp. LX3-4]MDJ1113224.1 hypothetical protein [Microbacterium sp. LX3-4]
MNSITARGLADEAELRGKKVVVVSATVDHARDAFEEFEALGRPTVSHVTRANGRPRIDFVSSGSVRFVGHRQHGELRGISADVVFVDWDVETSAAIGELEELYDTARKMTVTRAGARIIRA